MRAPYNAISAPPNAGDDRATETESPSAPPDMFLEPEADLPPLETVETLIISGVDATPDIQTDERLPASSREPRERGRATAIAFHEHCPSTWAALTGPPPVGHRTESLYPA